MKFILRNNRGGSKEWGNKKNIEQKDNRIKREWASEKLRIQSQFPRSTLRRYFIHVFVVLIRWIIHARLLLPLEDSQQLVSGLEEFALLSHHAIALLQFQLLLSQTGLQLLILLYDLSEAIPQIADLLLQVDRVESRLAVLLWLCVEVLLNLGQLLL